MTDQVPRPRPAGAATRSRSRKPPRLASRPSAGTLVGGILAGLEHLVAGRPKPVPQIEEAYRDPWASADGVTIEGIDERPRRPEPPDRSGARL